MRCLALLFSASPPIPPIRARSLQQARTLSAERDDSIASNAEQATGKKLEELEALARGESRFSVKQLRTKFGTYDNPVIVPSGMVSRIVGCQGGVEGVRFACWSTVIGG
jgi:hypothetical protein